jgi:hypothetical protein
MKAARLGKRECVTIFLNDRKAFHDDADLNNALIESLEVGRMDMAELLIEAGARCDDPRVQEMRITLPNLCTK